MYFIRLIVKGRQLVQKRFLRVLGSSREIYRREIIIKRRIVFGCCVRVDWSAVDQLTQRDDIVQMYLL